MPAHDMKADRASSTAQHTDEESAGLTSEPGLNLPVSAKTHRPRRLGERLALIGAWIVVAAIFSGVTPSTFLTVGTLSTVLGTQSVLLVVTLGLLIPMTADDYDLSVAAVASLSSVLVAVLNVNHHVPIVLAIVLSILAGGLVGVVNGAVVLLFDINPFIVTLGTSTVLSGLILWITGSDTISGVSNGLVSLVIVDKFLGIPLIFFFALVLSIVVWYFLDYTATGRRLLFVGRSRSVSRLSGVPVSKLRFWAFVASGIVCAIAGVLYVGTRGSADPTSGDSLLLPAFAAAFLGATSVSPGRYNVWGSFVAVYFLVTGITGLQLIGVSSFIQPIFYGGALVIAVVVAQLAKRRAAGRMQN